MEHTFSFCRWRYALTAIVLWAIFGVNTAFGADPTTTDPATKSYAGITFLNVAGTTANAQITDGDKTVVYNTMYLLKTLNPAFIAGTTATDKSDSKSNVSGLADKGFLAEGSSSSANVNNVGGYSYIKITSEKSLVVYVTGTNSVAMLAAGNNTSSDKWIGLGVEEVKSDASLTEISAPLANRNYSSNKEITVGPALNPAKYYKITITSGNTSNCCLWQIRFGQSSTFKVTYDGNGNTGGTVPTDATGYSNGASVTVAGNTGSLEKTGYAFAGWNTAADGTGTSYAAGDNFSISANTTLYAQWGSADRYTFHYGIKDGGVPYTQVDFVKQGLEHEWQVENFVMPETYNADMACYVGWNGYWYDSNLSKGDSHSKDKSADLYFRDMPISKLMQQGCTLKGLGWADGVALGAIGTLRIFDNYNENNQYIGFIPNGFGIVYGVEGSSPWTVLDFDDEYETDKHKTVAFDVAGDKTASDVKYYVGIAKDGGGYVFCGISETNFMAGAGNLMGTITTGRGCFRIDEHSCGRNFGCEFVGTHRIIYHANYPVAATDPEPADTYSEDVMVDKTKALSLNAAPAAPSGYTFAGWNALADGTYNSSERLSAGGEYILNHPSADVELYAQWEEDESPCFELKDITAAASKNLTTPVTTNVTIVGGKVYALDAIGYDATKKWELDSSSDSIRVELDYPLAVGSVISVTYSTNTTGERGIKMTDAYKSATHEHRFTNAGVVTNQTDSYTITSDDGFAGLDVLWFSRAESNKTHLSNITISGCSSCKNTKLKYAETSIEKTVGDAAFTNTLSNPNALSVSYTSTNTSVATVDGIGAVTIIGAGSTTIKATSAEQTIDGHNYCADEVSYTLTIAEAPCFSISVPTLSEDKSVVKDALITTGEAVVYGGTATYTPTDATAMTVNKDKGLYFGSESKQSIHVEISAGVCLGIGTTIEISGTTNSSGQGIIVYTTDPNNAIKFIKSGSSGSFTASYTLQAGDPWLDAGSFNIKRIGGSGSYLKSLTITNCGTPCTEAVPVISTTDPTTKCPGASVTMTCTGAEAGATLQWYKDGVAIGGATGSSYMTTEPGEYTCIATNACSRTSNPIQIINKETAMVHSVYSSYYIKQGRVSPPIPLFEVPGVVTWSVSPAIAGCSYEKDGDIIYLKGVPTGITTDRDETLTLTYDLGCGSSNTTMLLHELAETAEPTVAYIVVGTKNGGFTEGVKAEQSTGHPLYQYIEANGYTLTACNEYSTVDEKAIVEYYSQYDIVLITDYPSTKETTGGKSYGNALGVLVDKVPILSLETFLSGNSNWSKVGLSANPHTPQDADEHNVDQFTMDLLCPAHDIFGGSIVKTDNKISVIKPFGSDDGDKNTTGLQGFTSMEAPDGFIFIATIDGNHHGTLVTCCERQTVVEARLLLFGVNYYGSERMTEDGKLAVKQMLDYLLKKEKSQVADCAEIFDNGLNNGGGTRHTTIAGITYDSGDNLWSNPANWTDAHLPNALKAVLVEQPCIVDVPTAHASSIKLCKGTNEQGIACDGKLTIRPEGGLSVSSSIVKVNGTDHVNTFDIEASDLIIEANAAHQGALALGTKGQGTPATVQYYSKAVQSTTASTWQYMGVPFSEMNHAVDYFRGAWMCEWLEGIPDGAAGANWAYLANDDMLNPFQGYAITQPAAKTYTHTGTLLSADTRVVDLSYTSIAGNSYKGCNLVANSWMAPIRVKDFEAGDFHNANATIYIYNTGSYSAWETNGEGAEGISETTTAGQYVSLPVAAVGAWDISKFREIPPMQGFFVKATASDATLTLDFSKLVYSGTTLTNHPQRVSKQLRKPLRISVRGSQLADELFILPDETYSEEFDNGYDAMKMEGSELAPMLYAATSAGDLSVAAVPDVDQLLLGFRSGEDDIYTLLFEGVPPGYELHDLLTSQIVALAEGSTYTFAATPNGAPSARFRLVKSNMPGVTTDISSVQLTPDGLLINNPCAQQLRTFVYDSAGRLIATCSTDETAVLCPLAATITSGVYIIATQTDSAIKTQKIVF